MIEVSLIQTAAKNPPAGSPARQNSQSTSSEEGFEDVLASQAEVETGTGDTENTGVAKPEDLTVDPQKEIAAADLTAEEQEVPGSETVTTAPVAKTPVRTEDIPALRTELKPAGELVVAGRSDVKNAAGKPLPEQAQTAIAATAAKPENTDVATVSIRKTPGDATAETSHVPARKEPPVAAPVLPVQATTNKRNDEVLEPRPALPGQTVTRMPDAVPEAARMSSMRVPGSDLPGETAVHIRQASDRARQRSDPGQAEHPTVALKAKSVPESFGLKSASPAVAQNVMSPLLQSKGELPELFNMVVSGAETTTQWDPRTAATGQQPHILARADTPGMIGRQMALALQRLPDRPVEIALSPKELGSVRMTLSAVDGAITVSVLAERPETLDLMRRNIDALAREFQSIGYESINFAFAEGQQNTGEDKSHDGNVPGSNSGVSLTLTDDVSSEPVTYVPATGLDLRF